MHQKMEGQRKKRVEKFGFREPANTLVCRICLAGFVQIAGGNVLLAKAIPLR
jgi:hypothetical protein